MNEVIQAGMQMAGLWTVVSNPEVANKIIDTVSRGFSTLYEPKRIEKLLKKIEGEGGNISITNGDFSLKIEGKANENTIDEILIQSLVEKSVKEIINVNEILEKTAKLLETEQKISEEKVDTDWAIRYFNTVKDISNEEMKIIWSKLLADEITNPGSVSLRTIDILKNLSSNEAKIFKNIVNYSLYGGVNDKDFLAIFSDENILSKYGISFNDILLMQELNLLQSTDLSGRLRKKGEGMNLLNTYNDRLGIFIEVEESDIYINMYRFTKLGNELSAIVELEDVNMHLEELLKVLKRRSLSATIYTMERSKTGAYKGGTETYIK